MNMLVVWFSVGGNMGVCWNRRDVEFGVLSHLSTKIKTSDNR